VVVNGRQMYLSLPGIMGTALHEGAETQMKIFELAKKRCYEKHRICLFSDLEYYNTSSLAVNICKAAKDNKARSIIVGSRGGSAFSKAILGSVSSAVLAESEVPVTIVQGTCCWKKHDLNPK